jgi:GNAT superfamily N-acetyltransferase
LLNFKKIQSIATPEFAQAWQLYEQAFPEEERRASHQQIALLQQPEYAFNAVIQEEELVGLLGVWSFAEFRFLEHFAIHHHLRGRGLGKAAISLLQQSSTLPIILEVEPPGTLESQRRICFYQQLGFALNSFSYQQPPYGMDKPWVPLQVMSFPKPLSLEDFIQIRSRLYQTVYHV